MNVPDVVIDEAHATTAEDWRSSMEALREAVASAKANGATDGIVHPDAIEAAKTLVAEKKRKQAVVIPNRADRRRLGIRRRVYTAPPVPAMPRFVRRRFPDVQPAIQADAHLTRRERKVVARSARLVKRRGLL